MKLINLDFNSQNIITQKPDFRPKTISSSTLKNLLLPPDKSIKSSSYTLGYRESPVANCQTFGSSDAKSFAFLLLKIAIPFTYRNEISSDLILTSAPSRCWANSNSPFSFSQKTTQFYIFWDPKFHFLFTKNPIDFW